MEKLQKNYPVAIQWHAFLLQPPDAPPIPPAKLAQIEASRPRLEKMAREQYGLEINPGPFKMNSMPALVANAYAESQGKGADFHHAVLQAYWQHAQIIEDIQVLERIAISVGLESENFAAVLENPVYKEAVDKDFKLAHMYGLNAVPSMIFADKYLVAGAQPYDLLKQVVERATREAEEEEH